MTSPISAAPTRRARAIPAERFRRSAYAVLDAVARVHAALQPKPPPDDDPLQRAVGRWCNDRLALWRLCGRAGCRHARSCRGRPHDCLTRRAPQLPEDALTRLRSLLQRRATALRRINALPNEARK